MDDEPPRCYLWCCNVRSWTLAVSNCSIVILILGIVHYIASFDESPRKTLFGLTINILFLYINMRLRSAVLKSNITPVRVWLWVYSIIYVFSISMGIVDLIRFISVHGASDMKIKQQLLWQLVNIVSFGAFGVLFFHPVYQYYNYEKKNSLQIVSPWNIEANCLKDAKRYV